MSETIQAVHRTVLGKKVKRLREEGVLPGNIYGVACRQLLFR